MAQGDPLTREGAIAKIKKALGSEELKKQTLNLVTREAPVGRKKGEEEAKPQRPKDYAQFETIEGGARRTYTVELNYSYSPKEPLDRQGTCERNPSDYTTMSQFCETILSRDAIQGQIDLTTSLRTLERFTLFPEQVQPHFKRQFNLADPKIRKEYGQGTIFDLMQKVLRTEAKSRGVEITDMFGVCLEKNLIGEYTLSVQTYVQTAGAKPRLTPALIKRPARTSSSTQRIQLRKGAKNSGINLDFNVETIETTLVDAIPRREC